jgi:hypothetical protein
MFWCADSL